MTDQIVRLGPEYFPRPTSGIPIAGGSIYIGDPDTDPEIPGNQITVNALQENGSTVPISQPILTSGGGIPLYNGSTVTLLVSETYSLKVLDAFDVQVYYVPSIDVPVDDAVGPVVEYIKDLIGLIDISSPVEDQTHTVLSYFDGLNKGGGSFYWNSSIDKSTANGGTIIDPDTIGGFDGTVGTRNAFLAAQGTGVGFGCWVRTYNGDVNVQWFGSMGDGVTDDTASIQSALAHDDVYAPAGIYNYTTTIERTDKQSLSGDGLLTTLEFIGTGTAVDIQTRGSLRDVRVFKEYDTALNTVDNGIRFSGSNGEALRVATQGFNKGVQFIGIDQGCAYNRLDLIYAKNNKHNLFFEASGTGWSNENSVYGGRIWTESAKQEADTFGVYMAESLTNRINGNKFFGVSIESQDKGVLLIGATNNYFYGCRTELYSGHSYDYAFKEDSDNTLASYNFIVGNQDLLTTDILFLDNNDVDLGYNPGNFIQTRRSPLVPGNNSIQLHTEGYRKVFLNYSLGDSEVQFVDDGSIVFTISDSAIDFKETYAENFGTKIYTTASRPVTGFRGQQIYDYTLDIPLWWDGSNWVDATGSAA